MAPRTKVSGQRWKLPTRPLPIVFVGAGAIVRECHVPAYQRAGFEVRGVYDTRPANARAVADAVGAGRVFASLDEAFAERGVVFDVAVPPKELPAIVRSAPRNAALLVQKPLGSDLEMARAITRRSRERRLRLAVHFQLRFSPAVLALRRMLARKELGVVREVSVRVVTDTPWERWSFLRRAPRLEILFHSIHYLDLVRSLWGEPDEVSASARPDPASKGLADTRAHIELWYARGLRVTVHTNHAHDFGGSKRESCVQVEGSRGAARITLGVNLDYARPQPDELEVARGDAWRRVKLEGSWFPDAFAGPMCNLQRFIAGEDRVLETRAGDALRTMELVERCYRSSASGRRIVP
ncbi:MAG: Gfo/Idh/MocA family oxidoreductase [Planctomycetes bacterium]|nr:Gfo/Idh/MocA family oxidoreductase [Planctomycetota bacterium]